MRARFVSVVAAGLFALAAPIAGHGRTPPPPFSVEDLLVQESLGSIRFSPESRWLVIERRAPWNTAATYRYGLPTGWLLSSLLVVDPAGDRPTRAIGDPRREGLVA